MILNSRTPVRQGVTEVLKPKEGSTLHLELAVAQGTKEDAFSALVAQLCCSFQLSVRSDKVFYNLSLSERIKQPL